MRQPDIPDMPVADLSSLRPSGAGGKPGASNSAAAPELRASGPSFACPVHRAWRALQSAPGWCPGGARRGDRRHPARPHLKVGREVCVDLATAGDLNDLWGSPLHAGSSTGLTRTRCTGTGAGATGPMIASNSPNQNQSYFCSRRSGHRQLPCYCAGPAAGCLL
jgi:hypothetical protein